MILARSSIVNRPDPIAMLRSTLRGSNSPVTALGGTYHSETIRAFSSRVLQYLTGHISSEILLRMRFCMELCGVMRSCVDLY
jgi:hypothetical protein